ncbi:type VI secretion system tube protein Hcp [Pantoea sp. Bo_2]|uniref:type VI secretion system tube protein TssD n=1 Tax=unclassified Pantoea TaxID=2630326 RepID=UPI0012323D20|nr:MULTISPECIES: type VI secretion system tube protein TssD [unclassified Pantoea]KAA5943909.1 type VI secretion system tube protein Hcp [Pantoea sp. VH_3]KAA5951395.1 type VI secretion system tube protein Hcp [Pantoea sp. VH_25]KAA5952483.1 type VI secretion system tube protein Hcp [Pantoea sp. VH_24]KAA5959824.1 type VI secretion system tube protein Hcp [Pantoea sp. VH_16]KAA5962011.1 type VI secretion system tube protein Hcp [Pantoea sp. VH_18]
MAIPAYLWLKDDGNNMIAGSVEVAGREGAIEVLGLNHGIMLSTDDVTGKTTAIREHSSYSFDKEIDMSSPWLYRAVTSGQKLRSAEMRFYRINDAGQEVEYFTTLMEGVTVICVGPIIYDVKSCYGEARNHLEAVELIYEKITWRYVDGNIIHSDSWNERVTA